MSGIMRIFLVYWAYVGAGGSSIGSMFTPLATQLSLYADCAFCVIAFCACYSLSTWNTQFPFLTQLPYCENDTEYDQLSILNDEFTLNYDKLAVQGLPWDAASQLLFKVSRTIYIGAALTHFLFWHGKRVYKLIRPGREGIDDPHFKKMKAYPDPRPPGHAIAMSHPPTFWERRTATSSACAAYQIYFSWMSLPCLPTPFSTINSSRRFC